MTSRLLAVGVDVHENAARFPKLSTAANDARVVLDCFRDVHQLNGAKDALVICTSATKLPTRSAIMGALTEMARAATADDRLVFYFSGYGETLEDEGDELFLVPHDAFDAVSDALIPYSRIAKILAGSAAKETLVVLALHAETDEAESPNPKLGALTHYLARALRGQEPAALDADRRLTVSQLAAYLETAVQARVQVHFTGSPLLADFAKGILNAKASDTQESLAKDVQMRDTQSIDVTDILTKIRNWSLSEDQIAHAANGALSEYLAPTLGKQVPALRKAMGFSQGTVVVEGSTLRFPGGALEAHFEAASKRSGHLIRTLTVDSSWLERADRIPKIADTLALAPEETVIRLRAPIEVSSLVAGLEASGWEIVSELDREIKAEKLGTEWTFKADRISVRGIEPIKMFGGKTGKLKGGEVARALAIFAK